MTDSLPRAEEMLSLDDVVYIEPTRLAVLRRVVLSRPVALDPSNEEVLWLVWLLRECVSHRVDVVWQAGLEGLRDLAVLRHLPPPVNAGDDPQLEEWRRGWKYGTCYFRRGPELITIRDVRPERERRAVLDDPGSRRCFEDYLLPAAWCEDSEAATALHAADWLYVAGSSAVALPFRMRHWPIPYRAV